MKAIKIKMKPGCNCSNNVTEIEQIYLEGCKKDGFYYKSAIYDFLKRNPNSIQVNIYPYPDLQPVVSQNGEKYVRSEANYTGRDNLLALPRE